MAYTTRGDKGVCRDGCCVAGWDDEFMPRHGHERTVVRPMIEEMPLLHYPCYRDAGHHWCIDLDAYAAEFGPKAEVLERAYAEEVEGRFFARLRAAIAEEEVVHVF